MKQRYKNLVMAAVFLVGTLCVTFMISQPVYATDCNDQTFGKGNASTCVKYIQRILNGWTSFGKVLGGGAGASCPPYIYSSNGGYISDDGIFGNITKDKVQRFQDSWCLDVDGTVGPNTWRGLCEVSFQMNSYSYKTSYMKTAIAAADASGCW